MKRIACMYVFISFLVTTCALPPKHFSPEKDEVQYIDSYHGPWSNIPFCIAVIAAIVIIRLAFYFKEELRNWAVSPPINTVTCA